MRWLGTIRSEVALALMSHIRAEPVVGPGLLGVIDRSGFRDGGHDQGALS